MLHKNVFLKKKDKLFCTRFGVLIFVYIIVISCFFISCNDIWNGTTTTSSTSSTISTTSTSSTSTSTTIVASTTTTTSTTIQIVDAYYTIVSSAGENGTINPSGNIKVRRGSNQEFVITPKKGYYSSVKVNGVLQDIEDPLAKSVYTFYSVKNDYTIKAEFLEYRPIIIASAGANGTITPSGNIAVQYGSSRTFVITPNSGYYTSSIKVDGNPVLIDDPYYLSNYKFLNITENHTIEVKFTLIPVTKYTVIASAGYGGSILPSGSIKVKSGESLSLDIVPDAQHLIKNVIVDGVNKGQIAKYTFYDIDADHKISAEFYEKYSNIDIKINGLIVNDVGDETLGAMVDLFVRVAYAINSSNDLIDVYNNFGGKSLKCVDDTYFAFGISKLFTVENTAGKEIVIASYMLEDDPINDDDLGTAGFKIKYDINKGWKVTTMNNCQFIYNKPVLTHKHSNGTKVTLYLEIEID